MSSHKKLRVAIIFGYNGWKYHGSQKATGVPTVEGDLERALYESGFISPLNFGNLNKIGWCWGSRTDKGVHAIQNIVKCNIQVDKKYFHKEDDELPLEKNNILFKKIIDEINIYLPSEIKIFGIKRVTKHFVAKNSATSRIYEYILPIKILQNSENNCFNFDQIKDKLNNFLKEYEGTHNFHNYTQKGEFNNKQSIRYIMSCHAEAFQQAGETTQFLKITLLGQSFIYNQIRKMIGMVISMFQNDLDINFLKNSFGQNQFPIWLAPSEGLLLDSIQFKGYNKKSDIPEKIELSESELECAKQFKETQIYQSIVQEENDQQVFNKWLERTLLGNF